MMAKKHKSKPRNSMKKRPVFVAPEMPLKSSAQGVTGSTKAPSPSRPNLAGSTKVPQVPKAPATPMAARRSKATRSKSPGKGFVSEAKTSKKKVLEQKKPTPEAQAEVEAAQVVDPGESEEDREFRERYLSAEKETEPEWKKQMDAAKTKEDRFRVGLQVGDFKTSYGILAEELIGSFVDGDKERLDQFLTKAGVASWQLALIQLVVIGVPFAGITYVMGLWK